MTISLFVFVCFLSLVAIVFGIVLILKPSKSIEWLRKMDLFFTRNPRKDDFYWLIFWGILTISMGVTLIIIAALELIKKMSS